MAKLTRPFPCLIAVLIVGMLTLPMAVQATPIRWSVDDLTLTDGTDVAGGFTYDATVDAVSDIDVTLTNASYGGSPYTLANLAFPTFGGIFFGFTETAAVGYTGQATLWIILTTPLTDAGGSVPINTSNGWGWGFCVVADCTTASNPGDLQGSLEAVPEPGSLALLGLGLAGLRAVRRRARN